MSVLVFIDSNKGVNKAANEAVYYGKEIAAKVGGDVVVVSNTNNGDLAGLGAYGASKVLAHDGGMSDAQQLTKLVGAAANEVNASVVVFSQDPTGKAVAPRVAARLNAGHAASAIAIPSTDNGFVVKTNVFSGKAMSNVQINSDKKVVSLLPNTFAPETGAGSAEVVAFSADCGEAGIKLGELKSEGGALSLPEAELVVSAGRGLKGPENWGIVEDLATSLGAATACSRPVADIGWRPHHEHVGQTGVAIRPNLYIAAGISGAIQHLAGVNGSKTIVVINTDSEAPFFKAADYGIVGDAFEVLPKLTEAIKKFRANN